MASSLCVFPVSPVWEQAYLPVLRDRNVSTKVQQHALSRLQFLLK